MYAMLLLSATGAVMAMIKVEISPVEDSLSIWCPRRYCLLDENSVR